MYVCVLPVKRAEAIKTNRIEKKICVKLKRCRILLPFDFSHCSYDRDRGSSGLTCGAACVELPNELLCVICCDANSSVNRLAKLMASDPHTV